MPPRTAGGPRKRPAGETARVRHRPPDEVDGGEVLAAGGDADQGVIVGERGAVVEGAAEARRRESPPPRPESMSRPRRSPSPRRPCRARRPSGQAAGSGQRRPAPLVAVCVQRRQLVRRGDHHAAVVERQRARRYRAGRIDAAEANPPAQGAFANGDRLARGVGEDERVVREQRGRSRLDRAPSTSATSRSRRARRRWPRRACLRRRSSRGASTTGATSSGSPSAILHSLRSPPPPALGSSVPDRPLRAAVDAIRACAHGGRADHQGARALHVERLSPCHCAADHGRDQDGGRTRRAPGHLPARTTNALSTSGMVCPDGARKPRATTPYARSTSPFASAMSAPDDDAREARTVRASTAGRRRGRACGAPTLATRALGRRPRWAARSCLRDRARAASYPSGFCGCCSNAFAASARDVTRVTRDVHGARHERAVPPRTSIVRSPMAGNGTSVSNAPSGPTGDRRAVDGHVRALRARVRRRGPCPPRRLRERPARRRAAGPPKRAR